MTSKKTEPTIIPVLNIPEPQKPVSRFSGFSIKQMQHQQESGSLQASVNDNSLEQTSTEHNQPINSKDLIVAWRTFAKDMPHEEMAMSQRLDQMKLDLISPDSFEVYAENPTMFDQLKLLIHRIEPFLQSTLHHSSLKMVVKMREMGDQPRVLSKPEQVAKMREENPAFAKLEKVFALSL